VDSEAITAAIAEDGIADVVKEIDGAFALVYHDEKAKVLNIIRNSERPLTLGFLKDKSGLLIASEAAMLHWIAVRNGLEVGEYVTPPPGTLFTFDVMGDKGWSQDPHKKVLELYRKVHPVSTVVTPKPVATDNNKNYFDTRETLLRSLDLVVGELMICKPVGFSEYTGRTGAGTLLCESIEDDIKDKMDVRIYSVEKAFFDSIDSEEYIESTVVNAYMDQVTKKIVVQLETANVDIVLLEEDEEEEITEDTKLYKGPFGLKLTKKEFDDHTKNGCVFCGSNIEPEDDITWESDLPLCKNCSNPDLYMFN
jgi:glucosamine 6-phosphate synthetase-like amidotransferase/phosphosugar isomerase protein